MSYIRPSKNRPSNLSWNHFLGSVSNMAECTANGKCLVKIVGGDTKKENIEKKGAVELSGRKFSVAAVLEKIPKNATLVYAGDIKGGNKDYLNQFVRLSLMAIPGLLNQFRAFNETLLEELDHAEYINRIAGQKTLILLQEANGKFRPSANVSDLISVRKKEWVKAVKEYLAQPFDKDLSLPFPEAFGASYFDMGQESVANFTASYYKLSDTRYFNLDEITGLVEFLRARLDKASDSTEIHILSPSSLIDFLLWRNFKNIISSSNLKLNYVSKWIVGYEPMLYFIESLGKAGKKIIINISNLPVVEVLDFDG